MPEMEIKWSEVAHAQIPVSHQPLVPQYRRLLGSTDVDDDGDAIGKREIRAEFPFYDVEILHHQKWPQSRERAYHRLWCLVGLQAVAVRARGLTLPGLGGVCQETRRNRGSSTSQSAVNIYGR
jgi:hypothetical protein